MFNHHLTVDQIGVIKMIISLASSELEFEARKSQTSPNSRAHRQNIPSHSFAFIFDVEESFGIRNINCILSSSNEMNTITADHN